MSGINIEQQRAAFESWASLEMRYMIDRSVSTPNRYRVTMTQVAWVAWQAAIAQDRQSLGEPFGFIAGEFSQITNGPGVYYLKGTVLIDDVKATPPLPGAKVYLAPQAAEPVKEPNDVSGLIERLRDADKPLLQQGKFSDVRGLLREAADLLTSYRPAAQPSVPDGWKLVPDYKVGMRVRYGGEDYKIFARGDRPGTFDICHPTDNHRDRWMNVPPEALEPLATPPTDRQAQQSDERAMHHAARHAGWMFEKGVDGVIRMVPARTGKAQQEADQ